MKQFATGNVRAGVQIQPGDRTLPGGRAMAPDMQFMRVVVDAAAPSSRAIGIPANVYNFVTVFNNSRFDFSLSRGLVFNPLDIIGNCPAYTLLTFPFDREVSNLLIRWDGSAGASERCLIFLTDDNLGLVGQFRPPVIAAVETVQIVRENFGQRFFGGVVEVGTLFTAARATDIRAMYLANTLATAATVTIVHRRSGVGDVALVSEISIAGNSTVSLGYIPLATGDSIVATAVTGTVHGSIYGVI